MLISVVTHILVAAEYNMGTAYIYIYIPATPEACLNFVTYSNSGTKTEKQGFSEHDKLGRSTAEDIAASTMNVRPLTTVAVSTSESLSHDAYQPADRVLYSEVMWTVIRMMKWRKMR
jgi:hypothetical protein